MLRIALHMSSLGSAFGQITGEVSFGLRCIKKFVKTLTIYIVQLWQIKVRSLNFYRTVLRKPRL